MTQEQEVNMTMVFVDVEDSTGIANYYENKEYRSFLSDFHDVIRTVLSEPKWEPLKNTQYHKFFGDEFVAFLAEDKFPEDPVSEALDLAYKLKYQWYISNRNERRLTSDKEPIELNIGINFGKVNVMDYPTLSEGAEKIVTYEGFPITLAKRVQSIGEEGKASRIILADPAFRQYASFHGGRDFHNMGRKPLKGLSQSITCYEWLGKEFDIISYDKDSLYDDKIEKTFQRLRDKDPLNPWYATLLANLYYSRAEAKYYEGDRKNEWYFKTADVCLGAIQNITWTSLRTLFTMLLTCLEAREQWELLGYRADQAFNSDPTFADALAFRAKALLEQAKLSDVSVRRNLLYKEAEKEANRLVTLFGTSDKKENEALFHAHFVLAAIHSRDEKTKMALKELQSAFEEARAAKLRWAINELKDGELTIFMNISDQPEWKEIIIKFTKLGEKLEQ